MGINNTKLKAEEEVAPEKIRPLLYRQYEELKRCININQLQKALSQKKMIKDGVGDDESSDSLHGKYDRAVVKPCPNPEETGSSKEETVVRVMVEKLSQVVPLPDSAFEDEASAEKEKKEKDQGYEEMNFVDKDHCPEELSKDIEDKDHEQEKVEDVDDKVEVETEEGRNDEKVHEKVDGKNKDEEEDDDSHDPWKLTSIMGSPSFRIYCQPQENEEKEKSEDPFNPAHKKSLSVGSLQIAASRNSANTFSRESIESFTKGKYQKRKFGAVKKLLKVKSCYYPSCACTGVPERRSSVVSEVVHFDYEDTRCR